MTEADAAAQGKKFIRQPSATVSDNNGPVVKEIEVVYVGPKSVAKSLILANMRTTLGQPYSPSAVEEDVRNLYATGLFVNLRISNELSDGGVKVTVIVQPKPLVKEIIMTGSKKIGEKALRKETKTKLGSPLSEQTVAADADRIRELYQNKGFKQAQVTYKVDVNEEFGRAIVTFNIDETRRSFITRIDFVGNKNIPAEDLRKQFKTKPKNLFSFLNKSGLFKDDQFKEDLKKFREYYQSKGYIDVAVKDVRYEYPKGGDLRIVITVFEGIQYKVGKVVVEGNHQFTTAEVEARLKMKPPGIFSPQGLEQDIKAVNELYGQKGYVDTRVSPERIANVESGRMDLRYQITEGPQSFVEKIVIQGNNRTKDKVLRREMAVTPGEVYDSVRAEASKKRLENLGYFNKVEINPQETSVPGRKNMVVTVEEKRTGSVTFGVGFSSVDSLLGFVELSQGNFDIANPPSFLGGGQKFRARLQYGLLRRDFLISFTEPWFLNQRLSFGFDIFAREAQYLSSVYDQRNVGASVRLAKGLGQFWTASMKYQIENYDLFDFDAGASPELLMEKGGRSKSSVSMGLSYDTRDNVFLTRKGEKIDFTAEFAGGPLLGETDIWKAQIDAQKYFLLPWADMIFLTAFSTGVADRYDDTAFVPIFDRFFVGGSRSVRGFDNREVGPRDANGEPIGGRTYGYVNFELTFPLMSKVRGAVFVDAGFVNRDAFDYSNMTDMLNVGAGFGLRMDLPIGPLRLDFGIPIRSNNFNDSSGQFHFDVGYQF